MTTIQWKPSPRELRQWAALLGPMLGLVGALFYFLEWGIFRGGEGLGVVLWTFGGVAMLTGLTGTKLGWPTYWVWMALVYAITWVIGHAALAMVYFAVVTPLAMVGRLIGRDRLRIRGPSAASYWCDQPDGASHDPERPF